MQTRRELLRGAGRLVAGAGGLALLRRTAWARVPGDLADLSPGTLDSAVMDALPGKRALIKRSFRPPCYETPTAVLRQMFTPNDALFVRYHHTDIPTVKAEEHRLHLGGPGLKGEQTLSLADLRDGFPHAEVTAVLQCAGNRRGLFQPHVPGVQWSTGAIGNARWAGVRLRDVLLRLGLADNALEVACNGFERPVIEATPQFTKSLPMWKAVHPDTILAFAVNGEPLPQWNGAPLRLVVPGWYATYWMKHLSDIRVVTEPLKNFWMAGSYRVPEGKFPDQDHFPSQAGNGSDPVTSMVVNSLITSHLDGERVAAGRPLEVSGIAWDGGQGIGGVELSADGGSTWQAARLGEDHGNYSWRQWTKTVTPPAGTLALMARATDKAGRGQGSELVANPAGYNNNVIRRVTLTAA